MKSTGMSPLVAGMALCAVFSSSCGVSEDEQAAQENIELREALSSTISELQSGWFHRDRIRLYEEAAVHGALQAGTPSGPVLSGDLLIGEPLDRLDMSRSERELPPILFPDVRQDGEGSETLFRAALPEPLCWPAEFVFGQVHKPFTAPVSEGFGEAAEEILLGYSQEQIVEKLSPWLHAVAEWAGWDGFSVKAAPQRPFVLALDHNSKQMLLNPVAMALIVAAAGNQGRHLASAASAWKKYPVGITGAGRNMAQAIISGFNGVDSGKLKAAIDDYREYAGKHSASLTRQDYTEPEEGDTVCLCGCVDTTMDGSHSACQCHSEGCYCDFEEDNTSDEHTCDCAQALPASGTSYRGMANSLLILLIPLLFMEWRRNRARD